MTKFFSGKLRFVVGLRNEGKGVAKYPYLALDVKPPYEIAEFGLDGNGRTGLARLVYHNYDGTNTKAIFSGASGIVVYPRVDLEVTVVHLEIKPNLNWDNLPNLELNYGLACDEFPLVEDFLSIEGSSISTAVLEKQLWLDVEQL